MTNYTRQCDAQPHKRCPLKPVCGMDCKFNDDGRQIDQDLPIQMLDDGPDELVEVAKSMLVRGAILAVLAGVVIGVAAYIIFRIFGD